LHSLIRAAGGVLDIADHKIRAVDHISVSDLHMVNGTVQEKNGLLYTVISYYDINYPHTSDYLKAKAA